MLSGMRTRTTDTRRAAVSEGLRRSVDGDQGYSGLLTKNPVHGAWNTLVCDTQRLYTLDELAGHLGEVGYLPPASWKRSKRRNVTGLGRNCSIFETARTWAYRAIRHHFGDPQGLHTAVSAHVHGLNAEFPRPLDHGEAQDIANSIHRWITTRSRIWADGPAVYEATFSTIQAARGRRSGAVRQERLEQTLGGLA